MTGQEGASLIPCVAMSKEFRPWKIDEAQLLPPSVQDYVPQDHVSRLIVSLVKESLDLSAILGSYRSGLGQPPFDPRMMTALLLHGYASGIYSSRRIARATVERADFMMIVAGMGKSITATLFGILLNRGAYRLTQSAPIPEWQTPGDARAKIRIEDLLHMSSGLRIRAPQDPDYDPSGPYPDHLYLYTGGVNSYHYAATRPQQWPPNTVGRYRNTDPVLISYLIRLALEKSGEEYLSFPQRALFDKLGIRTMRIETDPFGNFLGQGYEVGCSRDWARLGNLYLQDGVWNGERILPEGYAKFVSTPAPAWVADKLPIYGGFFWINGLGQYPVPQDSYYMAGAGGQTTMIVPSHDLVVVRLGHYKGEAIGTVAFRKALKLLLEAVPRHD